MNKLLGFVMLLSASFVLCEAGLSWSTRRGKPEKVVVSSPQPEEEKPGEAFATLNGLLFDGADGSQENLAHVRQFVQSDKFQQSKANVKELARLIAGLKESGPDNAAICDPDNIANFRSAVEPARALELTLPLSKLLAGYLEQAKGKCLQIYQIKLRGMLGSDIKGSMNFYLPRTSMRRLCDLKWLYETETEHILFRATFNTLQQLMKESRDVLLSEKKVDRRLIWTAHDMITERDSYKMHIESQDVEVYVLEPCKTFTSAEYALTTLKPTVDLTSLFKLDDSIMMQDGIQINELIKQSALYLTCDLLLNMDKKTLVEGVRSFGRGI